MRLLLVDDEFFVRERIVKQMDWKDLGISDIREASGGLDALRIMQSFRPDILLTDVRMPQMDGIRLAEEVSRVKPDCKIIFISGYSDVPYLRNAIRLRAVSYVEKPINMEELAGAVRSAVKDLCNDHIVLDSMMILKKKDQLSKMESVARGLSQRDMLKSVLDTLGLTCDLSKAVFFVTFIMRLIGTEEENPLAAEEISSILDQAFPSETASCLCFVKQDSVVVHLICRMAGIKRHDNLEQHFHTISNLLFLRGLSAIYSVGKFEQSADGLPESFDTAQQTMAQCFYKRPGVVCYYQPRNANVFDMESISLSEFSHALKKDTPQSFLFLTRSLTSNIKTYDMTPPAQVIRFFYSVIVLIIRAAEKANVKLFDEFVDEYEVWEHIRKFTFLDTLSDFVASAAERYYALMQSSATNNSVVNRIIRFMEQNYQNPNLSITMVSESMKLSSTYICHLFKSVTGTTLGCYLTKMRIAKALELMEGGEYRVKDIARMVGYRNGNYFSYKFKRRMGYSPSGTEN